jgi:hypothetical protein
VADSKHWREAKPYEAHPLLVPYMESLKTQYRDSRLVWFETFVGMYSDMQDVSLLPSRATAPMSPVINKYAVPINVIAPLVDTAEARITQTRPRPFFKTVGGSWSQQRQAKRLQKFADGIFDETKAYRLGQQALKDAALLGTGAVKVQIRSGRIKAERVLVSDLLVDEALGFDRNPPEMGEVKEVSRAKVLAELCKTDDQRDAVRKLVSISSRMGLLWGDMVEVFEWWALPQGDEPGRHVIMVQGATLLDEEWKHDYYPIIIIRWRNAPTGFYGLGLAQQAMASQIEITAVVRNISKNLHLHTNPRVLNPTGSNINPNHITNAWGTVLEYTPPLKPELWTQQIVPPEVYQWFQMMYEKVFEMCGLSTQTAFAQKPAGLTAAKAIRELADIQSDRLAPMSQSYEQMYLDMATAFIDLAEQLGEEEGYSVVSSSSKRAERLKWKDVKMPKDSFTIQLFATNFLSRTPSGIFDDVEDLMRLQLIDATTARKLMDFPDLQQVFDDENAARDNFESQIEKILDENLYLAPQPFDDLQLGLKVYRDAYNRARLDDVPEDRQERMREWIQEAQALIASSAPPPAPPGAMSPGAPMQPQAQPGAM